MDSEKDVRFDELHDSLVDGELFKNDVVVRVLHIIPHTKINVVEKHLVDALDELVVVQNQAEGGSAHNRQLQLSVPVVRRIIVHVGVRGRSQPIRREQRANEGSTARGLPVAQDRLRGEIDSRGLQECGHTRYCDPRTEGRCRDAITAVVGQEATC